MALDEKLARYRRRIRSVCPEIEASTIRLIADEGQNNDVLILDERAVFRFPRYRAGIDRLESVVRILGTVSGHVNLAVPQPIYRSLEPREVGEAFIGYPMLPGEPLWRETLEAIIDVSLLQGLASQLAGFLLELHRVPTEEAVPGGLGRFHWRADWEDLYVRIRQSLFPQMRPDARRSVVQHLETFLADQGNQRIEPVLVHGDFGTGNVLWDPESGRITGVIDFDSAGIGDAAVDLAAALSGPAAFVEQFSRDYPITDAMATRMRFYRGTFALQEALFGFETGDAAAFQAGIELYR